MRAGVAEVEARRIQPSAAVWGGLVVLLLLAAVFLFHETRGTALWFDDWMWVLGRRQTDAASFLDPHNGHFSLIPIAIYRVLFATVGLDSYAPYRVLVIAAHLVCVTLLFVYASRRVGGPLALLVAALLLFLGPAWSNILWPFQTAWLTSLASGIGALLLLDRRDRMGDIGASVLLMASLASSSIGLPVAIGLVVEIALGRRRWRDAWIVLAPLAVYALWWVLYQTSQTAPFTEDLMHAPGFIVNAVAGALSALTGLAGRTVPGGTPPAREWGYALALGGLALLTFRLARMRPVPARVVTLIAMALSFWTLTALNRAYLGADTPYSSHYRYVGCVFILLLVVELAPPLHLSTRTYLLGAGVVAAIVLSNLGAMRDGAGYLRGQAALTRAELGAIDLVRPIVKPDFVSTALPGYPFVVMRAESYFDVEDADGTPAASPAEIASEGELVRLSVDQTLIRAHGIALRPAAPGVALGARPAVESVTGGTVEERGPCVGFRPAQFTSGAAGGELQLTVPPAGVLLKAAGGTATVSMRRFADAYPKDPLGTLGPTGSARVPLRADLSDLPWHLRVTPEDRATVCGLG
jgi:hypothetical protein